MRDILDYPLAAFRSALRTTVGWTAVMAITSAGGFLVARTVAEGYLAPLKLTLFTAVYQTISDFFGLPLFAAALAWTLGLIMDSLRFRVVAAVINAAIWAAVAIWAPPFFG